MVMVNKRYLINGAIIFGQINFTTHKNKKINNSSLPVYYPVCYHILYIIIQNMVFI